MANDNQDQRVLDLKEFLDQARPLHAILDLLWRLAIQYYLGQQWKQANAFGAVGVVAPSKNMLHIVDNRIAPIIRQLKSRLKIYDARAKFVPTREDSPEVHMTARMQSKWYENWLPDSRFSQFYDRRIQECLIQGSGIGTAYADENSPGGIRLSKVGCGRITLDPANVSQEFDDHYRVVDSQVISVEEAKRVLQLGVSADDEIFKTETLLSTLTQSESWFGRALFQIAPGAVNSRTKGLAIHREFIGYFGHVRYYVQNFQPTRKKDDVASRNVPDWKVVYDSDWDYGNIYLHLTAFDNPVMAFGTGVVAELMPPQNIRNMVLKHNLRTFMSRSTRKFFAELESILNPEEIDSTKENGIIWLTQGRLTSTSMPQVMQDSKADASPQFLADQAEAAFRAVASISENMDGQSKSHIPFASTELLLDQSKAPLRDMSETHRQRTNVFIGNVSRMGLDRMATQNYKKFVLFVGPGLASKALAKIASATVLDGQTSCSIRPASFIPETPEEMRSRFWPAVVAGHMTYREYNENVFELTGREQEAGQEAAYQQAFEIARLLLKGEEVSPRPLDNHEINMRVIKTLAQLRITEEYTDEQCQAFEGFVLRTKKIMLGSGMMDSAIGAFNPAAKPPASTPGATPPPPTNTPPTGAVPQMQAAG
jgi:hypothetical protein